MSTTSAYERDSAPLATPLADLLSGDAQHNQITFEIPTHHDLEHIDRLHHFNTLLQRIGNVAYDTIAADHQHQQHQQQELQHFNTVDVGTHAITSEQIAKSVVLNLSELKEETTGLERFFGGADMHSIINYLWIGVVTSLVVLSVIFIIFSCYFYRKFREWKKCNKDIRAHLNNDMYPGGSIMPCDSLLTPGGQGVDVVAAAAAGYYRVESPPCYTIATGLPSYDEALYHHPQQQQHEQQQQQQHPQQLQQLQQEHFAFGMKFMYPTIAAVHHHQQQQQQQQQQHQQLQQYQQQHASLHQQQQQHSHHHHHVAMLAGLFAADATISHWETQDYMLKHKAVVEEQQQQQQQQHEAKEQQQNILKVAAAAVDAGLLMMEEAPPAYGTHAATDAAATLLLPAEVLPTATVASPTTTATNRTATTTALMTTPAATNEKLDEVSICMASAASTSALKPQQQPLLLDDVLTAPTTITATTTTTGTARRTTRARTATCAGSELAAVLVA